MDLSKKNLLFLGNYILIVSNNFKIQLCTTITTIMPVKIENIDTDLPGSTTSGIKQE